MTDRLKWMKDGNGFIAYPEKPGDKSRMAEIRHQLTMPVGNQWQWRVVYDGAAHNGYVADHQAASDEANRMWPGVRERAREIAEQKRQADALKALVDRQALIGDVSIEQFEIEASSADRLRSIIAAASKHFIPGLRRSIPPNLAPLMAACSAELYRRRLAGSA